MATDSPTRRKASPTRTASLHELPTEQVQARRFGKARSARSSVILEDYVELIADLIESPGEARAPAICVVYPAPSPRART